MLIAYIKLINMQDITADAISFFGCQLHHLGALVGSVVTAICLGADAKMEQHKVL